MIDNLSLLSMTSKLRVGNWSLVSMAGLASKAHRCESVLRATWPGIAHVVNDGWLQLMVMWSMMAGYR